MSNDRAYFESGSVMAPADDTIPVAKSDTVADPNGPFRGILLDAAGTVKLTTIAGTDRTYISGELTAGMIHPIRFTRVWTTGTGSQGIKGIV